MYAQITKLLLPAVLLIAAGPAAAQDYLLDGRVKIQRHDKRTSSHTFPREKDAAPLDLWAMQFERSVDAANSSQSRLLHYEALPPCEGSDVILHEVQHHTQGTEKTDVLYFNDQDTGQKARAARYPGFSIAYQPALLELPNTHQAEYWQMFARFIQIECLPTRFRFTYIGSDRFMEYRVGDAAWEKAAN